MKKKPLIILISLGLLTAAGGGGAAAWWWYMNQPEQLAAQAQQYLTANRGNEAAELLTRLAEQGDMNAARQLATMYAEGKLVPKDETVAARYYQFLAEKGDEVAQREMADRCEHGRGVAQSARDAALWLTPFAERGDEAALRKLCTFYLTGALQDAVTAAKWYKAAAEFMPEAKRALADCYYTGNGVETNPAEAARLYEQVISADDAEGQYTLAQCYAAIGDNAKMAVYTERAAALGHTRAAAEMAMRYYDTGNYIKALPLLQSAAEAGNAAAAARLAICCEFALGMKHDAAAAEKWAEVAMKGGMPPGAIPKPTPTASQGVFDTSAPFTTQVDTSHLPGQVPQTNEISENRKTVDLYNDAKLNTPILYARTFDTFQGECLLANDDIIATIKNDSTVDFWDSRSLRYFVSADIRSKKSDEFYQYDAGTGRLGYRYIDNAALYAGGMDCSAIDFCTLDTEYQSLSLYDLYDTAVQDDIPKQSGRVFTKPAFRHLDKLSDTVRDENEPYLQPEQTPLKLAEIPALRDLVSTFQSSQAPLQVADIDVESLSVKRKVIAPIKENGQEPGQEPTALQIEGLDISKEWIISHATGNLYYVETSSECTDLAVAYLYDTAKKQLYPIFSESGFTGSSEVCPSDARIGETDMGWYTTTVRCWIIRFESAWMGDLVWDKENNRIYDVVDTGEKNYPWAGVHGEAEYQGHKIDGVLRIKNYGGCGLLSIFNRVPGDSSRAYWIAAGENGWSVNIINTDTLEVHPIANGRATWAKGLLPIWLSDRQWFCIPLNGNVWQIYHFDIQSAKMNELCCIYLHSGTEFAIALPDGRYAGTPGCESFLYSMQGDKRVDMAALAPWRNRPADVLAAVGGSDEEVQVLRRTTERWLRKLGYDPENMPTEPQAGNFPSVQVARPALRTNQPVATIAIKTKAADTAVTRVDVRMNGVTIPQSWSDSLYIAPGSEVTLQAQLPLVNGRNWVDVIPVDTAGLQGNTERFRVIGEAPVTAAPKMYVVAMGVSRYQDESLNLEYAAKDAGDIAEAFRRYYDGETEVLLLRDAEVDGAVVTDKVKDFLAQAQAQDHVVMYCAGHGMLDDNLEYHYAPHNFNSDSIATTGIAMDSLLDVLESTPARNRLLLLDTCHSGTMDEEGEEKMALAMGNLPHGVRAIQHRGMKVKKVDTSFNNAQKKRYIEELFATGTTRHGINVLAGAAGAEFALESGEWKNGVFTASVIEALSGAVLSDTNKDGHVDVAELYAAVVNAVSTRTGGAQKPTMSYLENRGEQKLVQNIGKHVLSGDWKTVESMCSQGYFLREEDSTTRTPWLALALKQGAPISTLKALIKAGVSVNCKVDGKSLLQYILTFDEAPSEKENKLRILIENGATLGLDELMLDYTVMSKASPDFIKFLIEHGADVNARDFSADTPLKKTDNPEIIKILLQHGADATLTDSEGNTVWDICAPAIRAVIREEKGEKYVSTILGSTNRIVAARLKMSASSLALSESEELRKVISATCAPVVGVLPKGRCSQAQLHKDIMSFFNRWPQRIYKVLGVARKDNIIEIKAHYKCQTKPAWSDPNPPRKTEGYVLLTIHLDENGMICALGEKTDKKAAPEFSAGMQEVQYNGPVIFEKS